MTNDAFKAALEATARVACCSFLIGTMACHAKKEKVEETETAPVAAETKEEVKDQAEKGALPAPAQEPTAAELVFPKDLQACASQVRDYFANPPPPPEEKPEEEKTEEEKEEEILDFLEGKNHFPDEVVACCEQLVNYAGGLIPTTEPEEGEWSNRNDCCDALNWRGACTPWGPPVPPATA